MVLSWSLSIPPLQVPQSSEESPDLRASLCYRTLDSPSSFFLCRRPVPSTEHHHHQVSTHASSAMMDVTRRQPASSPKVWVSSSLCLHSQQVRGVQPQHEQPWAGLPYSFKSSPTNLHLSTGQHEHSGDGQPGKSSRGPLVVAWSLQVQRFDRHPCPGLHSRRVETALLPDAGRKTMSISGYPESD